MGRFANRGKKKHPFRTSFSYWWNCSVCGKEYEWWSSACACCIEKKKEM